MPSNKIILKADFELIEQILINLIKNARESYPESHQKERIIQVFAEETDKRIRISVKDHGSGITKEILDQIFIPFFTTKKSGSGIGLSLSRQIMRLHKGTLEVTSVPGEGSIFIMVF
jgi:signal transduction histidine kinase